MRERVVITGIGCVSCFGIGAAAFDRGLRAGACGIVPITAFDTSMCHARRAALIQQFDPAQFIAPIKLRRIDTAGRIALASSRLLFDDAGLATGAAGADDVGIALGTFSAGLDSVVEYLDGLTTHGPTGVPAILFSNTVANAAASLCAIEFGLRGPNVTFNQREISSLAALIFSVGAIRDGRSRAIVTGGVDCVEETFFKVNDRFRALSPMRAEPDGAREEAARPFDRRHNGWVLGEGGFLLLLEPASAAERRGARPYGEILGVGITSSPTALNDWPADGNGLGRAMRLALADAEVGPDRIGAVFAAANGSPRLDRLEADALADVFGANCPPVTSIKGAVGEFGGAGAASIVAGLHSVPDRTIAPTVGFFEPDPTCRVNVSASAQPATGDTFLVNSVASGGTNVSVIVRASARPA
jgi:3-oxoacyl-[acyl-carrier-protein] synthase II